MDKLNYEFTRATYLRRNAAGDIVAREEVDPTTIYQLLDERGEVPKPPYPAFQRFLFGVPGALFSTDDMEVEPPYLEQVNVG